MFKAGKVTDFVNNWKRLTSDKFVIKAVLGCDIEFETLPVQHQYPPPYPVNDANGILINNEINKFLSKGIIVESEHEPGEYICNIFTRRKKDGSLRIILNLKPLNKFVKYRHFKMDTLKTCINLMSRNCFMASLDLKDAYYSIPVSSQYQKYLKFMWGNKLYKFTVLPMGLACSPRLFTKIMKPVYAHLRSIGHISSGYLDDTFLVAESADSCDCNVVDTVKTLNNLGLTPNYDKSCLVPTQIIEHLGFLLNSITMTVGITKEKYVKLTNQAELVLANKEHILIREVAKLLGIMVALCTGVEFGELYYKLIEYEKIQSLKLNLGDYDAYMSLSEKAITDIRWWLSNALSSMKQICHKPVSVTLYTDASELGWGAVVNHHSRNGQWNDNDKSLHINVLELKAIFNGLRLLCQDVYHANIKVLSDNMTAVAYVKNMGGTHSLACLNEARKIWEWAIEHDNWLTPAFIPGVDNVEADLASRVFNNTSEWKLKPDVFTDICKQFGVPAIDLFASKHNKQLNKYVTWTPDNGALAVDAFTISWSTDYMYCFPPFSLIPSVLRKLREDEGQALVVVPRWPSQPWFPLLCRMLIRAPVILPRSRDLLTLPHDPNSTHPLSNKMALMGCVLSGKDSAARDYRAQLKTFSLPRGENRLKNNMTQFLKSGLSFVVENKLITANPL